MAEGKGSSIFFIKHLFNLTVHVFLVKNIAVLILYFDHNSQSYVKKKVPFFFKLFLEMTLK